MLNSFQVIKSDNNLNRLTPSDNKVCALVGTGVAVAGKFNLGQVYTLLSANDAVLLGIDADYDDAHDVLVYHHIARLFMREPSSTVYFILADQTHSLADLADKALLFAKKALATNKGAIKFCGIFRNPAVGYVPVLANGLDSDVLAAAAKAQDLYNSEAAYFRFADFVIEGRDYNGTAAAAKDLHTLLYPNVSITTLQDPAIAASNDAYAKYAALGDVLGLIMLAGLSQNVGELSEAFNLTNAANNAFADVALSSGILVSEMSDADLALLDDKGYIFGIYQGVDGFHLTDSYTCTALSDDYAYIENNRVMEAAIVLSRTKILPKTKSRLLVDQTTGLIVPEIKAGLENDLKNALQPLITSGDISGGVDASIPDSYQDENGVVQVQNLLQKSNIFYELTFVPVAIGRSITLRIGFNNPNKSA